ncbi:MAG: hypothetical protein IT173_08240 [Acidobacteria bacterium]|nr:hypothetical protein [Acidobacteriota bacterium]
MLDSATAKHDHSHLQNRFGVIPTPKKLDADEGFSGDGMTIAFLDSGFYPHPDITDRVKAFHDIQSEERLLTDIVEPKGHHWHGTDGRFVRGRRTPVGRYLSRPG